MIQINSDYLEKPQFNTLSFLLQIYGTDEEKKAKFDEKFIELNKIAEGYIRLSVLDINRISDDSIIILKELYCTYRLYAKVEWEQEAEDKKKELDFLLKSEKERQLLENENKTEKKTNLMMVF